MNPSVTLEVFGDFALWCRPESKVERLTYPVPTPSGMRGLLSAVYAKPPEFYYQIRRIEVLNPIRYITIRRNEVKSTLMRIPQDDPLRACISIEEDRTQRQSVVLQDVRYRVTAQLVPQPESKTHIEANLNQFERRAARGQCFMQPCMGTREFPAYFEYDVSDRQPIDLNLDIGLMLYDTFDLHKYAVTKKAQPFVSLFRAQLHHGVLEVPPFDSEEVLKPSKGGGYA